MHGYGRLSLSISIKSAQWTPRRSNFGTASTSGTENSPDTGTCTQACCPLLADLALAPVLSGVQIFKSTPLARPRQHQPRSTRDCPIIIALLIPNHYDAGWSRTGRASHPRCFDYEGADNTGFKGCLSFHQAVGTYDTPFVLEGLPIQIHAASTPRELSPGSVGTLARWHVGTPTAI